MAPTLRQVATGTHIPNILAASNTTTFSRTPHILRSAVTALAIVLPNWYVNGQTETNAGSATWTAAIEYPAGTFTRVTFAGANSVTSATGGNIVSDMMSVAIPKGDKFWVRLYQNAPSKAVYFTFYAGDGTAQFVSPATDLTMGGTATTSAAFQAATTTPIAIIGMSEDVAVGIYGDSISVGRGDTADAGVPLQGHLGRKFGALYAAGHVGVSGDRMSLFLGSKAKRMSLATYFTHFVVNMGINDITNGGSVASVAADTDAIVALFSGPVALCTLSPVSTSTDAWNSVAAQTTVASNGNRITENTRRLAGVAGVKTIYDVNPAVETVVSPESGIWKAPGFTSDGTHPSSGGYKAESALIDANLLTVVVDDGATSPPTFTRSTSRTIIAGEVPGSFSQDGGFWNLADPKRPTGSIDPNSTIDITFDWTKVLADIDAGIADIEFDIVGLTAGGAYGTGAFATIFVSSPTGPASITCRITTDSVPPRIEDRTVFLTVEQH